MRNRSFLLIVFLLIGFAAHAQLRYGFKTGLNFANIKGPAETSAAGPLTEKRESLTGFHIGATFAYPLTRQAGLRFEALYSKKGTKYTFDGPAFRYFDVGGSASLALTTGNLKQQIIVNTTYVDLPLTAYIRLKDFEISAGAYASILISATGEGSMTYSGKTSGLNNPTGELKFNLDHNYKKDAPGEAGEGGQAVVAKVDARTLSLPKTLGAYYEYPPDNTNKLYNSLDYGLTGGVTYYLSTALYARACVQYGLADVTNNSADLSKTTPGDNSTYKLRNDNDRNFVIQASVGFSF